MAINFCHESSGSSGRKGVVISAEGRAQYAHVTCAMLTLHVLNALHVYKIGIHVHAIVCLFT